MNEYLKVACFLILLTFLVFAIIYMFVKLPRKKQIEAIEVALQWIVCKVEAEYGNGTGELKLRKAYVLFADFFPNLVNVITFAEFKFMVDNALDWMKAQQTKNKNINNLINNNNVS